MYPSQPYPSQKDVHPPPQPFTMNSTQPYQNQMNASAPPHPFDQGPATGIPVSPTNQHYTQSVPPATLNTQSQTRVAWTTGLCGCFEDFGNCCMTFWCPCVTFGRIAEIVDRGSTSCGSSATVYTVIALVTAFIGCPLQWLYSCPYRTRLRAQYQLEEGPCIDCLVHCCCELCALCQEYRELKKRGFDMTIGWHANVERQSRGVTTLPPVMTGGMIR